MRVEVVAVGTELLLGDVVDTNSAWIGRHLAEAGIDSHYQSRVGDNVERIVEVLRAALQRADAVVVCGGLGPTPDDVTRHALARVMGVALVDLLGPVRDSVDVYGSGGFTSYSASEVADQLAAWVDQGIPRVR